MCRMIAKISVDKTGILEEMLACPYSLKYLSENGRQPGNPDQRGMHHDGCGMAFSANGNVAVHRRSKENAWDESYCNVARTAQSQIFIAHNRLASEGLEISEQVSHPFIISAGEKTFALCHNGGVRTYMAEAISKHTSDSFIFLQKLIDENGENEADDIFKKLKQIAEETEFGSLCSFLISQHDLYVWRIYSNKDQSRIRDFEKYYTLYMSWRNGSALFSSEPLDDKSWMLLENNSFLHLSVAEHALHMEYRKI